MLTLGLALQQEKKFGLLILLRGNHCFYTLLHSRYTQVYMNGQQGNDIRVIKLPQVFWAFGVLVPLLQGTLTVSSGTGALLKKFCPEFKPVSHRLPDWPPQAAFLYPYVLLGFLMSFYLKKTKTNLMLVVPITFGISHFGQFEMYFIFV